LRDTVDPLAGSYFIETLTLEMEKKISSHMEKIQSMGGMIKAVSTGFIQKQVSKQAYEYEKGLQSGKYVKVGFNKYTDGVEEQSTDVDLHQYNDQWAEKQQADLKELKRTRNNREVTVTLKALETAARQNENVMPHLVKCCKAYATVGEMARVFRETFGEWKEPTIF